MQCHGGVWVNPLTAQYGYTADEELQGMADGVCTEDDFPVDVEPASTFKKGFPVVFLVVGICACCFFLLM